MEVADIIDHYDVVTVQSGEHRPLCLLVFGC